jgi:hypothetical protein
MIEGRPRESLVLYDNAIEVSFKKSQDHGLDLTPARYIDLKFRLLAVLTPTTPSRSHSEVSPPYFHIQIY